MDLAEADEKAAKGHKRLTFEECHFNKILCLNKIERA